MSEKTVQSMTREHNYGIDILRLLSMFYVVVLHTLGHGGVLEAVVEGGAHYRAGWALEIIALVAVDIFVLISGYVANTSDSAPKTYSRYLTLWFEVVFYSVLISAVIGLAFPGSVSKKEFLTSFLPVLNGRYWYFIAFTGLTVLVPLINYVVRNVPEQTLRRTFVLFFVVFSLADAFVKRWIPANGYSFVWLALLYFFGAVIRKCGIGKIIKTQTLLLGILILYTLTWLWKQLGTSFDIMKISVSKDQLVSYVSPLILGTAILYLLLFQRIRIGRKARAVVALLAPGAFATYLINDHSVFRGQFILQKFAFLTERRAATMVFVVVGFAALFLLASVLIDKIRQWLFHILKVKDFSQKIVASFGRCICRLEKRRGSS